MYCKSCGKEIDDNSAFCQFCGTKQNENKKISVIENTKICSVCGEEYKSGKGYCPFCTADYLPIDKLNDEFNCGRYNIAQQKGECIYKNHCVHSGCSFLSNKAMI